MSAEFIYAPPPPPGPPSGYSPRRLDPELRPPTLSTTFTPLRPVSQLFAATPSSAISHASNYNPADPTTWHGGGSQNSTYNPLQWGNSPLNYAPQPQNMNIARVESATAYTENGDIIGPPPPPYTPKRSPEPNLAQQLAASSAVLSPMVNGSGVSMSRMQSSSTTSPLSNLNQRHADDTSSPQAFPPPPPAASGPSAPSSRSTSRTRGERSQVIFGLLTNSRSRQSSTSYPAQVAQPSQQQDYSFYNAARQVPVIGHPPASRRAASTGAIASGSTPSQSRDRSRSPTTQQWAPGMPLPGPPPGPPPAARSQSMNRELSSSSSASSLSRKLSAPAPAPRLRRPPTQRSTLETIPPTPANWMDGGNTFTSPTQDLHIDTGAARREQDEMNGRDSDFQALARASSGSTTSPTPNASMSPDSAGGLARMGAVRGLSANKGIRERRSESRHGKDRAENVSPDLDYETKDASERVIESPLIVRPSDLVLSGERKTIAHRRTASKAALVNQPLLGSPETQLQHSTSRKGREVPESVGSTKAIPGTTSSRYLRHSGNFTATPPFSPRPDQSSFQASTKQQSPAIPPKALPTPPLNFSDRPLSHILHTPITEILPAPLSPKPRLNSSSTPNSKKQTAHDFCIAAIERHNAFITTEANAGSDSERLRLFADYIVGESQIRRQRYANSVDWASMDLSDRTGDLFQLKSAETVNSIPNTVPNNSQGLRTPLTPHHGSLNAAMHLPSDSLESPLVSGDATRPESQFWAGYIPSLSPIPSMAASDAQDEMSSRGRAPSRWWESSQAGSQAGGNLRGVERSKRESKYMGVPKELRESLQWDQSPRERPSSFVLASSSTSYGPNEYPQEKAGLHYQIDSPYGDSHALSPANQLSPSMASIPPTPTANQMDVSRLVTLPPPFPRHYPAVNNNHPDLTTMRVTVRSLSELSEVKAAKERFQRRSEDLQEEENLGRLKRRSTLRNDISQRIGDGAMTYAEAASLEQDLEDTENERKRTIAKEEYDRFQKEIVETMHALLLERVTKASATFEQQRSRLFTDAQEETPNNTQEQGDERPELLEKLTLLKWVFEVREQLHREIYDLLTDRNDRYRNLVMAPYILAGNEDKIRETEAFFKADARDRKLAYEKEILKRCEDFAQVIEENVVRGVEIQLSAFWDIAPSLLAITERIPDSLDGFQIQIPADEYAENPSYHQFPMQYFYSLLSHAEKSTYQFIEAQTNLLCLMHEVQSGVTTSNCNLMETQRYLAGEDFATVDAEMAEIRKDEVAILTEDLRVKVQTVEEQWNDALGEKLGRLKMKVKGYLESQGGWEDDD